jgi:hypothetical protein
MSRSYRYTSCIQDNKRHSKKWNRKQANKIVRHYKLFLPDGATYKKLYCQWDICDYGRHDIYTLNRWLDLRARWIFSDMLMPHYRVDCYYGNTIQQAIIKWKMTYYWR